MSLATFAKKGAVIAIDNILVSDDVVREQFVCDLARCKGGCCEDGDAGAPLEKEEMAILKEIYNEVKPYLTTEGKRVIEKDGLYTYDVEFGWVTPTISGQMCAYGFRDANGVLKCGIEQAWIDGKVKWKKPISCHLFPIKTKRTKAGEVVNYEPREDLCRAACSLGKKLKMPAYRFLEEAIVRKFGREFYEVLDKIASGDYSTGKK